MTPVGANNLAQKTAKIIENFGLNQKGKNYRKFWLELGGKAMERLYQQLLNLEGLDYCIIEFPSKFRKKIHNWWCTPIV